MLFAGLFVLNEAVDRAGLLGRLYGAVAGIDLASPAWPFAVSPVLSNLVSNVPAVMLLLPASSGPLAGATLALASTFAGNLLLVGSIANIIVVERAARQQVAIDWRQHARTGVPVTQATLAVPPATCAGCLPRAACSVATCHVDVRLPRTACDVRATRGFSLDRPWKSGAGART